MGTLTRRRFGLGIGCITAINFTLVMLPLFAKAQVDQGSWPKNKEGWLNEIIKTRGLEGILALGRFVDEVYFTTQPTSWKPDATYPHLAEVKVPAGFVTDLASIPPIFFSILRPDGEYAHAAVVHDYLYWVQDRDRDQADLIFKAAMEFLEVSPTKVDILYEAVRTFGASAWNNNAALRQNGERRILTVPPTDPRTRWNEYKQQPGVLGGNI